MVRSFIKALCTPLISLPGVILDSQETKTEEAGIGLEQFGFNALPTNDCTSLLSVTAIPLESHTLSTDDVKLPFGMPKHGVNAVWPDLDRFIFPEAAKFHGPELPARLIPPAATQPPRGSTYPDSHEWILREDNRFARHRCYVQDKSMLLDATMREKSHNLHIVTPPNVNADYDQQTKKITSRPIPGMVQMIPGVPHVWFLDGDPRKIMFAGSCETLQSLQYHPEIATITAKCKRLFILIMGRPATATEAEVMPLWAYAFLKLNQRATKGKKMNLVVTFKYDGSFSFGATLEQGEGRGRVVPAIQVATPEMRAQIREIFEIINYLFRQVVSWSLSKQDMEINDFHAWINNLFSLGGMDPGSTSLQLNVSSSMSGGDMIKSIGEVQGKWHVDWLDHIAMITLFILLFRLPPGMLYTLYL